MEEGFTAALEEVGQSRIQYLAYRICFVAFALGRLLQILADPVLQRRNS
jgi:hypothetical protein